MTSRHPGPRDAPEGQLQSAHIRAAHCRMLLRLDTMLTDRLGRRLAGAPYLTFLLELYLAELEGKPTFQSCIATDEPPANAHRRAAELAKLGALKREADPADHRRVNLRLKPKIREALDQAMDGLMAPTVVRPSASPDTPMERGNFRRKFDSAAFLTETDGRLRHGRVMAGGRIALPAHIRRSLGLQTGDAVTFELDHDQLRIRPSRNLLGMVQERLHMFAPTMGLASAEFIAMRRIEAAHVR